MKKVLTLSRKNPEIIFFLCAFILWTALMCWENSKEGGDFSWHDLKVEANGLIFDLFMFGILVTVYNAIRAKKEKIERLKEEIDDYREWHEKEARFRIMGLIKRLVREGETKLNLQNCYMAGASFADWDLSETRFGGAIMDDVKFYKTNLFGASFEGVNLNNAKFYSVELDGANLSNTILLGTDFSNSNMSEVNLIGAQITPTIIVLGDSTHSRSSSDWWFDELEKNGVKGLDRIRTKYFVDAFGTLQLK